MTAAARPSALPPNTTALEQALEAVMRGGDLPVDYARLLDPWRCPPAVLPFLAWHFSVDDWEEGLPVALQRGIVADSLRQHRRRGTVASIREALDLAGWADAQVIESGATLRYGGGAVYGDGAVYAPGDQWAEYRVRVPRPMTEAQAARVRARIEREAPLRCHLVELSYPLTDFVYGSGEVYGTRVYGGTQYG